MPGLIFTSKIGIWSFTPHFPSDLLLPQSVTSVNGTTVDPVGLANNLGVILDVSFSHLLHSTFS